MAADIINNNDDDDWEYEYSTTETETYYVDLDLSTVNGVIKSQNAGDRKSLKRSKNLVDDKLVNKGPDRPGQDNVGDEPNENGDDDVDVDDEREAGENQDVIDPALPQSPREPGLLDEEYKGRMQILDFNTSNPIVSFNGHLYSCKWHDMLGTSMFITKHQEAPFHEPEISTEDYDLIGTSRIKLVGHRAKILPKAATKKRRREDGDDEIEESSPSTRTAQSNIMDGSSLGNITRTNPRTNIEIKQQANFLEKLMEVKKSRGEHDVVRTFVDRRTVAADARQARKAKKVAKAKGKEKEETAEQRLRREINELNKRVVKGDNEALERLQEIYADMEEVEDEEDEVMIQDPSAAASIDIGTSIGTSIGNAGNPGIPVEGSEVFPHAADSNPNGASGSAAFD